MAKIDPFLSLDCARVEGGKAQSKERKGSNFAAQRSGAIVLQARRAEHIQYKNLTTAIWQQWFGWRMLKTMTMIMMAEVDDHSDGGLHRISLIRSANIALKGSWLAAATADTAGDAFSNPAPEGERETGVLVENRGSYRLSCSHVVQDQLL